MGKIIKLQGSDRTQFVTQTSKHLSDMLNTKITFMEVLDELFLYESGMNPSNEVLSRFVIKNLEDCTINQ